MNKRITTLAMVRRGDELLLGMKKRGFGRGRWNGFGGKVEEGESVEQAMCRELFEESGLEALAYKRAGLLEFLFPDGTCIEVNVFCVDSYRGDLLETEEMRPCWFSYKAIPFQSMWPDDRYWIPLLWERKKFQGAFSFDKHERVVSYELREV